MKLLRTIANLGYGSRKEVAALFREGRVTDAQGAVLYADDRVAHGDVRIDGAALDPPQGLVLMLHKPTGYTCSTKDRGRLVHSLLPPRYARRSPALSTVGRLDRDTSGLLLLTDDGALAHRLMSPRHHVPKVYEVQTRHAVDVALVQALRDGVLLKDDPQPVRALACEATGERQLRLTLAEGRYHQVKRMVAAAGNRVEGLHRSAIGALQLPPALAPGDWIWIDDVASVAGAG
jgi:16S rRNA pseudouridine516 synthase